MRFHYVLALALVPACMSPEADPAPAFTGKVALAQTQVMVGEHPIEGVDSDGEGGLWIAYGEDADHNGPKQAWITHVDASGAKLSEWAMNDHFEPIRGIAFAGDNVWLDYQAHGAGDSLLRELDAKTGETRKTLTVDGDVTDLAYDVNQGTVLLSTAQNEVIGVNPLSGGRKWSTKIVATSAAAQRGIADDGGRLWIGDAANNTFYYLDSDGTVHATATTTALTSKEDALDERGIAWDGSQLIVATRTKIVWLDPQPM